MCTNPEMQQEGLVDMEPETRPQVTMVSDPDILKVCRYTHLVGHEWDVSSDGLVCEHG